MCTVKTHWILTTSNAEKNTTFELLFPKISKNIWFMGYAIWWWKRCSFSFDSSVPQSILNNLPGFFYPHGFWFAMRSGQWMWPFMRVLVGVWCTSEYLNNGQHFDWATLFQPSVHFVKAQTHLRRLCTKLSLFPSSTARIRSNPLQCTDIIF